LDEEEAARIKLKGKDRRSRNSLKNKSKRRGIIKRRKEEERLNGETPSMDRQEEEEEKMAESRMTDSEPRRRIARNT
jgi:hypothetical protein